MPSCRVVRPLAHGYLVSWVHLYADSMSSVEHVFLILAAWKSYFSRVVKSSTQATGFISTTARHFENKNVILQKMRFLKCPEILASRLFYYRWAIFYISMPWKCHSVEFWYPEPKWTRPLVKMFIAFWCTEIDPRPIGTYHEIFQGS